LTISLRNDSSGYVIADAVRVDPGGNGNAPPVAEFTTGQQPGTLTIDFDGGDSDDPDGSIVSYDWDFGDGTFGAGVAPSHAYAAAGSYDVSLTVTDDQGATDRVEQMVAVQPAGGAVCPAPICDNTDTGFATVGSWASSSRWPGYYATDYAHDKRADKGSKTASWTYAIAANGSYDVAAQWSAASNRASSVQYMYSVDGGAPQNCGAPVDQRVNGGQFNGLCTVPALAAGSTLTISLRNDSSGYVIADAVLVTIR
jgi:chitodextrinase